MAEIALGLASSHTPQMSTSAEFWKDKFDRAQAAVGALARRPEQAAPDVVVIVGDDRHELFGVDGVPAIGLFTGERLWDLPADAEHFAGIPKDIQRANWAGHADAPDSYPLGAGLSEHLAAAPTGREFDVTVMSAPPKGRKPATWNRDRAARTEQETAA